MRAEHGARNTGHDWIIETRFNGVCLDTLNFIEPELLPEAILMPLDRRQNRSRPSRTRVSRECIRTTSPVISLQSTP